MRIYKYVISMAAPVTEIAMPEEAEILSVGNQRDSLVLWIKLPQSISGNIVHKRIVWCMTGREYHLGKNAVFIGTVLFDEGNFVVHVFEDK